MPTTTATDTTKDVPTKDVPPAATPATNAAGVSNPETSPNFGDGQQSPAMREAYRLLSRYTAWTKEMCEKTARDFGSQLGRTNKALAVNLAAKKEKQGEIAVAVFTDYGKILATFESRLIATLARIDENLRKEIKANASINFKVVNLECDAERKDDK